MSKPASSGIQTSADGQAFIPSSRRADGTTRKEIKVRPGYRPPEDVETYKSRTAETWRTKGSRVPGTEELEVNEQEGEAKGKNAKRREAARKKKEQEAVEEIENGVASLNVSGLPLQKNGVDAQVISVDDAQEQERQKKIRNQLKKLRAVRELRAKKATGEKLTADQLVKISKEQEIVRDLTKLEYNGPELEDSTDAYTAVVQPD